jgi:uncharacterized membrane protein
MSRRDVVLAGAGAAGFLVSCLLVGHGLRDGSLYSDVHVYDRYAGEMTAGRVPYRDFFDEYPPLAQPVFLLARIAGAANYALAFKAEMALCGVAAVVLAVVILRALRVTMGRAAIAVAATAVAPLLVGPIFLNAYDLWPAFLLTAALAALVYARPRLGFALLGAAVAAKVYPVAVLPVALAYLGRGRMRAPLLWFVGVLVLVHLPFAGLGPGGLRFSYWVQAKRGLELNSLGAAILLAADRTGIYTATIANRAPGSDNLIGALPDAIAVVSSLLVLAAIAAAALVFARSRRDARALVLASAAAVAGFVAFDKVFSAQYVDWLVPLAPLAGAVASGLTVAVLALTRVVFSHRDGIHRIGDAVWLLVARDLAVLALWAGLLAAARRRA